MAHTYQWNLNEDQNQERDQQRNKSNSFLKKTKMQKIRELFGLDDEPIKSLKQAGILEEDELVDESVMREVVTMLLLEHTELVDEIIKNYKEQN